MNPIDSPDMKPILMFPKKNWSKGDVQLFLESRSISHKIRYAFDHIVIALQEEIDISRILDEKRILCLLYDRDKQAASSIATVIEQGKASSISLAQIIEQQEGLAFDIMHFGYFPVGGADAIRLYEDLESACMSLEPKVFKLVRCDDLIGHAEIPDRTRKLLLDFYALHGTAYLVLIRLQSTSDILSNYSQLFLVSFVTRALYEKLMLIMASIDPGLDYAKLEGGKSMKRKFVEQSKRATLDLTKKLSAHIRDLELLDDYFRSPEVHKVGRLLGLIYNGYRTSLLNEVCAFFNTANHFFIDTCKFLRQQHGLQ